MRASSRPDHNSLSGRSVMLRLGRHYPGKKTWGRAHMNWLMQQKLDQREQRIALEELLGAVRQESERVERLEQAIRDATPEWSLAEVVTALQGWRRHRRQYVRLPGKRK